MLVELVKRVVGGCNGPSDESSRHGLFLRARFNAFGEPKLGGQIPSPENGWRWRGESRFFDYVIRD